MTSSNPTFVKALVLLAHPFSLAAVVLLLVNDHLLRRLSPSWWTGKLGDLCWLFFVPLLAAVILSWLIPGRKDSARHEILAFAAAYTLTGLVFILVKTVPLFHLLVARIFVTLTGVSPSLVLDPGDLLALTGLFLSVALWRSQSRRSSQWTVSASSRRAAWALMILPLAAMVLMADAAAPDPGITCFSRQENKIFASAGYNSYVSQDGGITWEYNQPGAQIDCTRKSAAIGTWQEAPGPKPSARYRYQSNVEIQLSTDGGKTWQSAFKLTPITQAEQMYYRKSGQGSPKMIDPGPLDAIADPATGNMLFAMGQQGVLVHTGQGKWVWSQSGNYQRPASFPNADAAALLLGGMFLLALGLALLVYATLALRWTKRWPRIVVLVLAWLAWLCVVLLFPPATTYSYEETFSILGIAANLLLIVPLAVEQTFRLFRRAPRSLPRLLLFALAAGVLFLVPYALWIYNALPNIILATLFALALAAAVLAASYIRPSSME